MSERGRRAGNRRAAGSSPRHAVLAVLGEARRSDAYLTLALRHYLRRHPLPSRSAALVTDIVAGATRQRSALVEILAGCADRPATAIDPDCTDLLCAAGYEYLIRGTPGYAVASEWVGVARDRLPRATGLVNAVLRRLTATPAEQWWATLGTGTDDLSLARRFSHPPWLVTGLLQGLASAGGSPADLPALLAANNRSPHVTLAVWPPAPREAVLTATQGQPGRYSPWSVRVGREGWAGVARSPSPTAVQDEGSQLIAYALARAPMTGPDRRWLDLAAGPGGKAALLCALLAGQPAAVLVAADLHPHRARLTLGTLDRVPKEQGPDRLVVCADGRRGPWSPGAFDRVLCDVPCSGSGALCRRPDARWRRQEAELPGLIARQRFLLEAALRAVRPGGRVLYAACSLLPAETVAVVDRAVAAGLAIRESAAAVVASLLGEDLPAGPDLWLLPHRHGTDGMYAALLRRADPA